MRSRLSYLAVFVVPLAVYAAVVWGEFGTPLDFLQLKPVAGGVEVSAADHAADGILHAALVEVSFAAVKETGDLRYVRALSVLLLIFCALALRQLLERGGWSELDAAAAGIALTLLPGAQLAVAWATAWPGLLAALLALAGFAAIESELEPGGGGRGIAIAGGGLLYLASAMCYFPALAMALVPLTGVGLARVPRLWPDSGKWFWRHAGMLLASIFVAWIIERAIRHGAGMAELAPLPQRLLDLVTFAIPSGLTFYFVAVGPWARGFAAVAAVGFLAGLVWFVSRLARGEERTANHWRLIVPSVFALFALIAVLAASFSGNFRAAWPLGGVAVVIALSVLRAVSERPAGRPWWHHAVSAGFLAAGITMALSQVRTGVVDRLEEQWAALEHAVRRATFTAETRVQLRVEPPRGAPAKPLVVDFQPTLAGAPLVARRAFETAVHRRFANGLPKGVTYRVEVLAPGAAPEAKALVYDFTRHAR